MAGAAILAQLVWRGVIVSQAVPRQDDFLLASQAHRSGFAVIFDDYHGHVQVVGWLVAWLADLLGPLQHWPLAVTTIALQGIASVLGWLAIRALVGPRLPGVLGLAVLLFSPLTVGPLVWAAAAVQMLVLQIAIFAGVVAHQRAVRHGTGSAIVAAWLVVGLSLLANEKALVVPLVLFCLVGVSSVTTLRESLHVDRTLWMGYVALAAGEIVLYLSVSRSDHFQPMAAFRLLAGNGFASTWLPQITAVPISGPIWAPLIQPPPAAATVLGSLAAIAVTVLAATRTGNRTLRAVALLTAYLVADYVVIAVSRLGFGTIIAIDPRYIADTVPVAALCLAIAMTRMPGDRPWRIGRISAGSTRRRTIQPLIGVCLAVAVYAASSITVTAATAKAGREAGNAAYVAKVRHELSGRTITLVDGPVPGNVIADLFVSQARVSELTSVLPGHRQFSGLVTTPMMVDKTGAIVRAAPGPGSQHVVGPEAGCGWSVLSSAATSIPVPDALNGQPGIVSIGYVLGAATPVTIDVAGQHVLLHLKPGLGHLFVIVDKATGPIVATGVLSGVRLCISDVTAGPAAPA